MLNVVWVSYNSKTCHKTQWDMSLLHDCLDRAGARHFENFEDLRHSNDNNGHVFVVIAGQHQLNFVDNLNLDLWYFSKVTLCIVGDEENLFPIHKINHPNIEFFVQSPKPGMHDRYPNRILFGYPPDMDLNIKVEKKLDWFFAGQVNHKRREDCCKVLRTLANGVLLETPGFLQGFGRPEYSRYTAMAKVIPCPSGVASPDSFRMCEALEYGCIPIVDGLSPRQGYEGFWEYVLGEKPPFPVILDWNNFPKILQEQLASWPTNAQLCKQWWVNYKDRFVQKLKSCE